MPEVSTSENTPTSEVSSSALLMFFALQLWSARTLTPVEPTLFGPGGECELDFEALDTLCCPSDSGRVALALTTGETGCTCLPRVPTPTASLFSAGDAEKLLARREREKARGRNGNGFGLTLGQWIALQVFTPVARDWKGSTGKGSRRNTLAEQLAVAVQTDKRTVYPHPEFVEAVMRFPISWTDLGDSETASTRSVPSGSPDA